MGKHVLKPDHNPLFAYLYQLNVVCNINYEFFLDDNYKFSDDRPGSLDFLALFIETNSLSPPPHLLSGPK